MHKTKSIVVLIVVSSLGIFGCSHELSRREAEGLIERSKMIERSFNNSAPDMAECEAKVFDPGRRTVTNRWSFGGRSKDLQVQFGLRPVAASVLESARIERSFWNNNWTLSFVVKMNPKVTVTGITIAPIDQNERLVEYEYVWPSDRIANATGKCIGDLPKGVGKAAIKLYDDGWRVQP